MGRRCPPVEDARLVRATSHGHGNRKEVRADHLTEGDAPATDLCALA
jgi:hypothetical protein